MTAPGGDYLSTAEAAQRLGVKTQTVYAYVSRGLLNRVRVEGQRTSVFVRAEVDRLARRAREGSRPAGSIERIASAVTLIEDDELYFRGRRVADLVVTESIESVASLLWTGECVAGPGFATSPRSVAFARAASAGLPEVAPFTDRLRVGVIALGAADPERDDCTPDSVVRMARETIGAVVDALPGPTATGGLADRLRPKLCERPEAGPVLHAALMLLADHGLATSTVAARITASTGAHPYAMVSTGLSALDGSYHGTASRPAYRLLAEVMHDPSNLTRHLAGRRVVPGFGHRVYRHRDPRAEVLLPLLPAGPATEAVDRLVAGLRGRHHAFPNVDLALAAMLHTYGMRPDAGEVVFAVARMIGFVAHAIEEYREPRMRFRPNGIYKGPPTEEDAIGQ
ncbi:citrate synthase [Amycolatopsis bartoniae]|uniref:citrate synthase (unknown stereospecificity) n=1 Tax=Amycolatopsis bartoniae TaxID=941986 RepID=A0A8H9J4N5_9PSEU|nr:citrate/2-methylcitrate synthase [Amycolatopsis bartoniae]MBB2935547.1 citrate synthase [Amycolatopsis bartoniae]TVT05264.1 helix-turn-helix domain-containing protein [Amycolatopsis bartoniae]GHF76687.1 citrate synthase [Amycolatopsis bartoniae]